jgi:hypothetical protein
MQPDIGFRAAGPSALTNEGLASELKCAYTFLRRNERWGASALAASNQRLMVIEVSRSPSVNDGTDPALSADNVRLDLVKQASNPLPDVRRVHRSRVTETVPGCVS